MSVLVVGLSHKSAQVKVLESAAIRGDPLAKLLSDLACAEPVAEVLCAHGGAPGDGASKLGRDLAAELLRSGARDLIAARPDDAG